MQLDFESGTDRRRLVGEVERTRLPFSVGLTRPRPPASKFSTETSASRGAISF